MCVQYVLDFFGKEKIDVIDLTREIQYPNLERGATLQAVAYALEKRGIHTFPMCIAPETRLRWPYPVIAHLKGENGSIGHFAVWFAIILR